MWVLVIGGALTGAIAFALSTRDAETTPVAIEDAGADASSRPAPTARPPVPGEMPHASLAFIELGVLHREGDVAALLDPVRDAALLAPRHCGDAKTCDAVRAFVKLGASKDAGAHAIVQVMEAQEGEWELPDDLAAAASELSPAERASLAKMKTLVVRAEGDAFPDQLPARAAYALAGLIAEKLHGFVHDRTVTRIDRAATFVAHAITAPLGGDAFDRERIDVQFAAHASGDVRLTTSGMMRFGCPDLEVTEVEPRAAQAMNDVLEAAADACARGETRSPITLDAALLSRVHRGYADGGAPLAGARALVGIERFPAEDEDPTQPMAQVVPPLGATPEGYAALAKTLFGDALPTWEPPPVAPPPDRARVQKALPGLLARTKKEDVTLYVQVAFGDAGPDEERLWLEVKGFDDRSISGTLLDDSARDPDLQQGIEVTRPRADVLDYQVVLADGGVEEPAE